jgi:hypothetical protein
MCPRTAPVLGGFGGGAIAPPRKIFECLVSDVRHYEDFWNALCLQRQTPGVGGGGFGGGVGAG